MKPIRPFLICWILVLLFNTHALATRIYSPNGIVSVPLTTTYCLNSKAQLIKFKYHICHTDIGSDQLGVSMTVNWYRNTVNSTTGGTLVKTTSTTCPTVGTGTASYLPSTSTISTYYYYCVITWVGTGSCNTDGMLVSPTVQIRTTTAPGPITGNTTICDGTATTTTLSNTSTGGTWSSSNTAVATVDSLTGVVTKVSRGSTIITYTTGCGSFVTATVYVTVAPTAIIGVSSVCSGQSITLANGTIGGTWSSSNTAVGTVNSGGVVRGITAGSATITYNTGCGTAATKAITVNTSPANISGTKLVCTGTPTTLSDATGGGTWSSANTAIATVGSTGIVNGVSTGTANISYIVSGCPAIVTVTVTFAPSAITGNSGVCVGSTTQLSNTAPGGTWTSSSTARATVDNTGLVTGVATGSVTITYNTGCGSAATKAMTVNAAATPITGTMSFCEATSTTLHAATGGTWSSSNAAVATFTVSASNATVAGVSGGNAVITYNAGACFSIASLTVRPLPNVGSVIAPLSLCKDDAIKLDNSGDVGGYWTSNNTMVMPVDSDGVAYGVALGSATATYTLTNGCGTRNATKTITILPVPNAGFITNSNSRFCSGATSLCADTSSGGVWSTSNTTMATVSTSGLVTGVGPGYVTVYYTITNGCNTDYAASRDTVLQVPTPLTGVGNTCPGMFTTFMDLRGGGTWSSSNTGVATVVQGAYGGVVSGVAAGTALITYNLNGRCYTTKVVTVNPLPAAITYTTNQVCQGSTITMRDVTPGGFWTAQNTISTIDSNTGVMTGLYVGPNNITYTVASTGCQASTTVNINPLPSVIYGVTTIARTTSTNLYCGTPGGTWSSSNSGIASIGATTGLMTGMAMGIATITYTLPTGCISTKPVSITGPRPGNNTQTSPAPINPLVIYPNPTNGTFTLQTSTEGTFFIYSIDGREVGQFAITDELTPVTMPTAVPKGVYMGVFKTGDGNSENVKIIYE